MKGVIGILLIVVGLEVAYLVLAGKLPLQIKPKPTKAGTGGGPDSVPDVRKLVQYGTARTRPYSGLPVVQWNGLQQ